MTEHLDDHGKTPAAWTVFALVCIGFIVGTVGLLIGQWPVFWVGVGIVIAGGIIGKVMQAAGLGKAGLGRKSKAAATTS